MIDASRFRANQAGEGKLDGAFANAGIAKYARFGKITEKLYDSIFDVIFDMNVRCLLVTVQKVLPLHASSSLTPEPAVSRQSVYSSPFGTGVHDL